MPAESTPSLDEIRDATWDGTLACTGDDWVAMRLRQLAAAAQGTPLRNLFPYTSHNSLHFSRCSHYPFTQDCPWIWFAPEPHFVAYAPHPTGIQGNLADSQPPVLLDTDDPAAAVAAAVQALPPHYGTVWIGSIESQP
ncbi:hypothetical protein FB565_007104 [Actinoplanes lutulentus]|uniref:Uncharacterized protein n=1 Tax=Actinoplanes lutulentus TaxID=1287878 RepID=A0A327ZBD2_9ACTN|nr:DUF6193 family natural product biosynthesis protein [Actinoplanes lutulentus]MBB2947336.1 hypothetical protein [Actinoplanes lutulentus]RAK36611.1 hypothetical protein B0I29_108201 [Actinoplanes lutulentus]